MLKVGTVEQIQQMFKRLQDESSALVRSVVDLIYFMRGALHYDEAMNMTPGERDIVKEYIKNRLEQEKDNPYPNY